LRESHANLN
jgi:hypothetical protein